MPIKSKESNDRKNSPIVGKQASVEFQRTVEELKKKCIKTLTDGVYQELKDEYGESISSTQYVATLYSIYIQFSCGLLKNIDNSLKEMFENEK